MTGNVFHLIKNVISVCYVRVTESKSLSEAETFLI